MVAEAFKRLDFRDAKTMKLDYSIATPDCAGINHADFSIDGRLAVFTCEFGGAITKIDLVNRSVMGTITLSRYFDRPEVAGQLLAKPGRSPGTCPTRVRPAPRSHHARHAAGRARVARRQDLLSSPT